MDPKYIQPFVIAVQKVFDTMIDVPLSLKKPYLKKDKEVPHEISGIIGLSGNVSGCVVVSMSHKIAFRLVSSLELDRRRVRERIGRLEKQLNQVHKHRNHQRARRGKKGLPIVSIPCQTDVGDLVIEIALKEKNGK